MPKEKDRHKGMAIFIRVPVAIHSAIKDAADAERRTINSQVVVILDAWLAEKAKVRRVSSD